MEEETKYRDELTNEVRTYKDWVDFSTNQNGYLRNLCKDDPDRIMIRQNTTNILLADLKRLQH